MIEVMVSHLPHGFCFRKSPQERVEISSVRILLVGRKDLSQVVADHGADERLNLTSVIADLEKIFARYEIDTLAPSRGVLINGRTAVRAKITALLAALRAL
jgi:hypothetical protein